MFSLYSSVSIKSSIFLINKCIITTVGVIEWLTNIDTDKRVFQLTFNLEREDLD